MANENFIGWKPISMKAGAAISKGMAVKMDGTNAKQVVKTAAITDLAIGFALHDAAADEQVSIMPIGPTVKAYAGAATTINAELMSGGTTDGGVEDASGATARSCGVGLEAAGAAGDLIEMILTGCPKGPPNA